MEAKEMCHKTDETVVKIRDSMVPFVKSLIRKKPKKKKRETSREKYQNVGHDPNCTDIHIYIDIRTTPYVCLNMCIVPLKVSLIALLEFVIPMDIRIPSLNRLFLFLTHATSGFS